MHPPPLTDFKQMRVFGSVSQQQPSSEPYVIIPRLEKWGRGDWRPCLILPDDYPPYLGCYSPTDGHGGMSYQAYHQTRKPNTDSIELARTYARGIPNAVIRSRLQWRTSGRR
jgi:hypothetical protein